MKDAKQLSEYIKNREEHVKSNRCNYGKWFEFKQHLWLKYYINKTNSQIKERAKWGEHRLTLWYFGGALGVWYELHFLSMDYYDKFIRYYTSKGYDVHRGGDYIRICW